MIDFFEIIESFLSKGGWVLYVIFVAIFILWILIVDRFWYFYFGFKKDKFNIFNKWKQHSEPISRLSLAIWQADFSKLNQKLRHNIVYIKMIVSLCPLLGLLGTVTGMVTVFDIMARIGTGNARLMASGISMATVPTMAGMVGALSGIYITRVLENHVKKYENQLIHWFTHLR